MKTKTKIQKPPKKEEVGVQSARERNRLIEGWKKLLASLPYCEVRTSKDDGEIRDNPEIYGDALFTVLFSHDMSYYEQAYAGIYFLFKTDGTVESVLNENISYLNDVNDPAATAIVDFGSHIIMDSWNDGYEKLAALIKAAYFQDIPTPPLH